MLSPTLRKQTSKSVISVDEPAVKMYPSHVEVLIKGWTNISYVRGVLGNWRCLIGYNTITFHTYAADITQ